MPMRLRIAINRADRPLAFPWLWLLKRTISKVLIRNQALLRERRGLSRRLIFRQISPVDLARGCRDSKNVPSSHRCVSLHRELFHLARTFSVALPAKSRRFTDVVGQIVELPIAASRLNRFPIAHADRYLATDFPVQVFMLRLLPPGDRLAEQFGNDRHAVDVFRSDGPGQLGDRRQHVGEVPQQVAYPPGFDLPGQRTIIGIRSPPS